MEKAKKKRILAASSGGGHWDELIALRDAFDGGEVIFATTIPELLNKYSIKNGHCLPDCNRNDFLMSIRCFFSAFYLVFRSRADVVISTGAAPGLFCLLAGRIMGKKTIWIDSIANAEKLSMSGRLAGFVATTWLTQWQHLARPSGPHFAGAVL